MWSLSWASREVGHFLFWFVIYFCLVASLKLQVELSEIHRSRNGVSYNLKSRVSHWSREKLLRASLRENDIRSSIQSLGARSRCRSRKRRATWPCCRSRKRRATWLCCRSKKRPRKFPWVQTSRWLAAFLLCDLPLACFFLYATSWLAVSRNRQTERQTSDWLSNWAGLLCCLVPRQQL